MCQKMAPDYRSIEARSFVVIDDFIAFHKPFAAKCSPAGFFSAKKHPHIFVSCPFMIWFIFINFGVPGGLLYRFFIFIVGFKSGRTCITQWYHCTSNPNFGYHAPLPPPRPHGLETPTLGPPWKKTPQINKNPDPQASLAHAHLRLGLYLQASFLGVSSPQGGVLYSGAWPKQGAGSRRPKWD